MNKPLVVDSQEVEVDFGGGVGIFDQTYGVPEGTILGMIGPSGCGKTTTMRVALGLLAPHKGHITTLGRAPTSFRAREREQIGYLPQHFVLYPRLTVAENARFVASLYGMGRRQINSRLEEMLAFVELDDARDRLGQHLSGGMKRRLMLAGALMHDPALLFADEPTAGIDPVLRGRFWEYFRRLRDEGRTLFISTQYVGEAIYCDYVAVMRKGRILVVDTPDGLRRRVLGGEIIHLHLYDPRHMRAALERLKHFVPVKAARRTSGADDQIYVTVEDAGEWLPEVLNFLEKNPEVHIPIARAEKLQISYDDIFITLMQEYAQQEEAAND